MSSYWNRIARHFLPLAFVLLCLSTLLFLTTQQNLRDSVDDPLIDQAYGIASTLKSQSPKGAQASNIIDIANSNQLFVVILDSDKKELYSTGKLDGSSPTIPDEIIKTANEKGESRSTWEPKKSIKTAVVAVPYTSPEEKGVVVVGKSLKDAERKTNDMGRLILLVTLGGLVLLVVILAILYTEQKQPRTSVKNNITTKPVTEKAEVKSASVKTKRKTSSK